MTAAKKTPRKTLALLGAKGADDRVRVLEDEKADEVVVQYKDGRGVSRKRSFPRSKQGRKDAVEWGKAYHSERARGEGGRPETTHAQLWKAYSESPAFSSRRPKTRINYTERWRKWMHYRGERTRVDETTLHHVDKYYASAKLAGKAVNQIRNVIAVARVVYNWGQSRKLVTNNELALYRWASAEGEEALEPEEYSEAEFLAILAELPAQSPNTWRAHVALMLAGHQGIRANAILHLRWEDIDTEAALLIWPSIYQKNRLEFVQPMTWDAVAALETARYWREQSGYEGPWVLYAGGGGKSIGPALLGSARSYRKERPAARDVPYTYGAWHRAVYGGKNKDKSPYIGAEERAGVTHKPRRGFHGYRKMTAGNVADRTGDARLAMSYIGDRDMAQSKKYLKRRDERMEMAATSVETKAPLRPEQSPQETFSTVSELSPVSTITEKEPRECK